jgi:hypothetical protein
VAWLAAASRCLVGYFRWLCRLQPSSVWPAAPAAWLVVASKWLAGCSIVPSPKYFHKEISETSRYRQRKDKPTWLQYKMVQVDLCHRLPLLMNSGTLDDTKGLSLVSSHLFLSGLTCIRGWEPSHTGHTEMGALFSLRLRASVMRPYSLRSTIVAPQKFPHIVRTWRSSSVTSTVRAPNLGTSLCACA